MDYIAEMTIFPKFHIRENIFQRPYNRKKPKRPYNRNRVYNEVRKQTKINVKKIAMHTSYSSSCCRAATAALHVWRCTLNPSAKLCLMRAACESCTSSVGRLGPPFLRRRPPEVSSVSSMALPGAASDNVAGVGVGATGLGVSGGIRSSVDLAVGGGVHDGGTLSLELTELALRSWIDSALFRLRSRREWSLEFA